MSTGVDTCFVNIGSEKRMKYRVVGDDVNLTARVESFAVGGEVLVSEATWKACGDIAKFRGPFEVKAKSKKEPLKLYAVVSVGSPYNIDAPTEHRDDADMTEISLPVEYFKIAGKEVAEIPKHATIQKLATDDAELTLDEQPKVFDNWKLRIHPPAGEKDDPINDVYAKVTESSPDESGKGFRCRLRFTSVPEPQREWLDNIVKAAVT